MTGASGDMLRDTTARAEMADGAMPQALWSALEGLGLPYALPPEDAGGFGAPLADTMLARRLALAPGAARTVVFAARRRAKSGAASSRAAWGCAERRREAI